MFSTPIIISIISILASMTLGIYFNGWRKWKRLSYKIITEKDTKEFGGRLDDDGQLYYVNALRVKLINDGSLPITSSDFESPINLTLGKAKIIGCEQRKAHPDNFEVEIEIVNNVVEIKPCLFNRGEFIGLEMHIDSEFQREDFEAKARIIGISEIKKVDTFLRKVVHVTTVFLIQLIIIGFIWFFAVDDSGTYTKIVLSLVNAAAGTAAFFVLGSRSVASDSYG